MKREGDLSGGRRNPSSPPAESVPGKALQEARSLGVVLLDAGLRILSLNEGFRRIGGDVGAAPGVTLPELLTVEGRKDLQTLLEAEEAWGPLDFQRPGKRSVTLRCTIRALPDERVLFLAEESGISNSQAIMEAARLSNELGRMSRELSLRTRELEEAQGKIRTLRALLPTCASCKKIRTEDGSWEPLEEHVCKATDSEFSHGLCPECGRELYGEDWEE